MKVSVIHSAFGDTPHVVAFVDPEGTKEMEAMEYAYRWTNGECTITFLVYQKRSF